MKPVSSFVISQFTNPSGEIVFRVSGWLDGQRVRKNFATRAEGHALQILQTHAENVRTAVTRLTDDQLHEAEAVFLRLSGRDRSLSFYVDFALSNYREPAHENPLAEAIAEYVAAKGREYEQGQLSISQFERIRRDLKRLEKHFPGATVSEMTAKCQGTAKPYQLGTGSK